MGKLKRWTEKEVDYLRKVYPKVGSKKAGKDLNRTRKSVLRKAEALGIRIGKRIPRDKKWVVPQGMKHCPLCGQTKPMKDFSIARSSPDGKFTYCRPCLKKKNAQRTPELRQKWHLRQKYGISLKEYMRLFQKQKGLCAICHKSQKRWLTVDHDHENGKVRSLLCNKCNGILGLSGDSLKLLNKAMKYLIRHNRRKINDQQNQTS